MNSKTIKIFMLPLQYPCGPDSSCCGPIGQSEETLQALKNALERDLSCMAEIVDTGNGNIMEKNQNVLQMLQTFGPSALPVITLDGEIVCMGASTPDEAVAAIREKMNEKGE